MSEKQSRTYLLEKICLYMLRGRVDIPDDAGKESENYYLSKIADTLAAYGGIIGAGGSERLDNMEADIAQILEEVTEIERHIHSAGSWFELAGTPDGEDHVAVRIGNIDGAGPFVIDAGNDTWGDWVQILGADDTPARPNQVYFDPHEIVIASTERTANYYVQFTRGASGEAGYAAGTYTELVYTSNVNRYSGIISVQTGRAPAGSKLWARCMCPGENTGTMNFFIGIHEYAE